MTLKYWLIIITLSFASIPLAEAVEQGSIPAQVENVANVAAEVSEAPVHESQPMFKLIGFGSIGALHSSQSSGDYVLDSFMPAGAGRSSNVDYKNYSKLALQLNAFFTPKVSAQVQAISAYHADGSFQPEVEWVNLKYALNSDVAFRVGRIELPTFLDSGNHDVGYSYAWAHLPIEMYHLLSIQTSDGIDASYRFDIGEARNSTKVLLGQNISDRPTSTTTSKDMWGIFDTFEYHQTTFILGYQKRNSSLHNNLTGIDNNWYESSDLSVGVNYDPGVWFLMSEWIQSQARYNDEAMYVSAGYRIKKFTPYFTHSQNNSGTYPSSSVPGVTRAIRSQKTDSVGVRWDFRRNYDFKLQYDRVTLSDNSNGFLINVPANVNLHGDTFYVASAVVDFIF